MKRILIALFALLVMITPAFATPSNSFVLLYSNKWAGYVDVGSTGATYPVTIVGGNFIVPTVTCAAGENSNSGGWVGIGGAAASDTLMQIGVWARCVNGVPNYGAFQEVPPTPYYVLPGIHIHPGDSTAMSVSQDATVNPPKVGYNFSNYTTGESLSFETATPSGALWKTAAWIVEAPSAVQANYNHWNFTNAQAIMYQSAIGSYVGGGVYCCGRNPIEVMNTTTGDATGLTRAAPSDILNTTDFAVSFVRY